MSKQNKVNKNNYVQRGRLTPDEMARERPRQATAIGRAKRDEKLTGTTRSSGERESTPRRSGRGE